MRLIPMGLVSLVFAVATGGCLFLALDFTSIASWTIPETKWQVEVSVANQSNGEVERIMVFRKTFPGKQQIKLARGSKQYARLNIYRISETQYVLRDVYKTYLLDLTAGSLQENSAPAAGQPQKFVGAFDYNENGKWRYIPEAERGEISN